jgi:hypothetical protein
MLKLILGKINKLSADLQALVIGQFGTGFVTDTMLSDTGVKQRVDKIENPLMFQSLVQKAGGVLYLDARAATAEYGLPVNSPLTTPWIDISDSANNATPSNMAGTVASGVNTTDIAKPYWALDGVDDFFSLINTESIDITAAPLAIFSTLRIPTGANVSSNLIAKSTTTDFQYRLVFNAGDVFSLNLNGTTAIGSSGAITRNVFVNFGVIWDGTNVKYYGNIAPIGTPGTFSNALVSGKPNVRIGCRSNSADGLVNTAFLKCDLATLTMYTGASATETNILKAEKLISKAYIGA